MSGNSIKGNFTNQEKDVELKAETSVGAPKTAEGQHQKGSRYEGPIAPVVASIVAILAWAVFILIYALYWSSGFNLFQNFIVTVVSLLITGLLIGLMWILLGPRDYWRGGSK